MNLNNRISKIIEYSNFTSSEFADEIDVQRSSVSHITSGRNKPSLEFIIKIKNRFPEIQWDWLINGEGEMLKNEEKIIPDTTEQDIPKTTALPDLFSLIDDESFGRKEVSEEINFQTSPETNIHVQATISPKIDDSQRLGIQEEKVNLENTVNQNDKIKRIVIFYESGKFESFQQ